MKADSILAALAGVLSISVVAVAWPLEDDSHSDGAHSALLRRDKFSQSCKYWGVYPPYWGLLQGQCRQTNGEYRQTWLALNRCLVNVGGQLHVVEK